MGQSEGPRVGSKTRAGIGDVAALAGVAQGTVSNVLNHPDRVSATTREKVERAMAMLSYVPNGIARTLAVGASSSVALVLSDLSNSLFIDIARGAETAVGKSGASLLMANTDSLLEREQSYLRMFAQSRVAGIMITLNDATHYAAITEVAPATTPVVMLNYRAEPRRASALSPSTTSSAAISLPGISSTWVGLAWRSSAAPTSSLRSTTASSGSGGPSRRPVSTGRSSDRSGSTAPTGGRSVPSWQIARAADLPDGVFAASDLLAAGLLQALTARGDVDPP